MAFPGSTWKRVPVFSILLILAGAVLLSGCPEKVSLTPSGTPPGKHLLRFALITDVHILDEESPARFVRFENFIPYSWRPQDAYTAQVLDATLQRINAIHAEGKTQGLPVDFVMASGDVTDNAQYNELRWFIDTMDGKQVCTDSGEADGIFRDVAPEDNPKLPFDAAGLNPEIPWYVAAGNHDLLSGGNFAIDRSARNPEQWHTPLLYILADILRLTDINFFLTWLQPSMPFSPAVITAAEEIIDPDTLQIRLEDLEVGAIAPDPDRHYVSKALFMDAFFNTTTEPAGHGFTQANVANNTAFYSFRPKGDVPVRIVVLNTVAEQPPWSMPVEYGVMTRGQFYGYVKPVIRKAAREGEYVIIIAHHSTQDFNKPYPGRTVKSVEFEDFLATQPHVIAYLHGHEHTHEAKRMPGPNPWLLIGTASLLDLPQEGRLFDIYWDDVQQRPVVASTFFSHMDNPTRLSAESYCRAVIDREYNRGKAN